MVARDKRSITVQVTVNAGIEKVWDFFTSPEHIIKWNTANSDWHTPRADNDLRVGGKFIYRMESRDSSFGFDFSGQYEVVKVNELIKYTLDDERKVEINFTSKGDITEVKETFEPETENLPELQQTGWQAILDNFKNYTENTQ